MIQLLSTNDHGFKIQSLEIPLKLCRYAYETPEIQSLRQNELFSKKENIDRFCMVLQCIVLVVGGEMFILQGSRTHMYYQDNQFFSRSHRTFENDQVVLNYW